MKSAYSTLPMWIVYIDSSGQLHKQPWQDLLECGTLIDGQTDEDMEIVGWTAEPSALNPV